MKIKHYLALIALSAIGFANADTAEIKVKDSLQVTKLKDKWNDVKAEVKRKWGKLTDDDVARINGNKELLVNAIAKKYHATKEKALEQVDAFVDSIKE